jgi:FkbM family methyltransferase
MNKTNGFFIELGANDGLTQSNTAMLEFNRGWKGILIEPSPNAYAECSKNRPASTCFNLACVSNTFEGNEIRGDFNGGMMSSVDGVRTGTQNLLSVQVSTLEKILDSVGAGAIDLLSLDTEGYELEILKGLNLNKHRPRYMLIEIYTNEYSSIVEYLSNHSYSLVMNMTNYNTVDNPHWDGTHNDYLFIDAKA